MIHKCFRTLSTLKNGTSSSRKLSHQCKMVVLKQYGNPEAEDTLCLRQELLGDANLQNGEVLIKMKAAPLNPADINTIQGTYSVRPKLPAVIGNEGFGEVIKVNNVSDLAPGDWVIPKLNAFGTVRTHAVCNSKDLIKIPSTLSVASAATLAVNPCTAYRMLEDFEKLSPGDTVLQSAAGSAVGRAVIQIARERQLRTVNVIRERPGIEELRNDLLTLGADHVVTVKELRTTDLSGSPPRVAFDAVGGRLTAELMRHLTPGGTVVVYGGMSRAPVTVPVGQLIFRDITVRGYWMTRWNLLNTESDSRSTESDSRSTESDSRSTESGSRSKMLYYLSEMAINGRLKPPPHEMVPIDRYKEAIKRVMPSDGQPTKKQIVIFE